MRPQLMADAAEAVDAVVAVVEEMMVRVEALVVVDMVRPQAMHLKPMLSYLSGSNLLQKYKPSLE